MSTFNNLIAGLGGAIALNILHESLKRTHPAMPRIDLLGEEAVQKGLSRLGTSIDDEDNLYRATLGSDLVSNAMYYSLIGSGDPRHMWSKALYMGASAGIGALTLPAQMGLDDSPVTKTTRTKALTVGYYVFGALVTGGLLKLLNKNN